jgi:hypothetical protein
VLLGGCAVSVDAPDADAGVRSACQEYVASVPAKLADQGKRDVDDAERGAAWGDPAIVLTCGVAEPEGFTPVSRCQNWDGVDWYIPDDEFGDKPVDVTMTTVGRSPRIRVQVPKAYWPPTSVMIDLAPSVKAHTKKTGGCV